MLPILAISLAFPQLLYLSLIFTSYHYLLLVNILNFTAQTHSFSFKFFMQINLSWLLKFVKQIISIKFSISVIKRGIIGIDLNLR